MNSKHNNNISGDVIIIKRLYYMSYDDWYGNCKLQEGCHLPWIQPEKVGHCGARWQAASQTGV